MACSRTARGSGWAREVAGTRARATRSAARMTTSGHGAERGGCTVGDAGMQVGSWVVRPFDRPTRPRRARASSGRNQGCFPVDLGGAAGGGYESSCPNGGGRDEQRGGAPAGGGWRPAARRRPRGGSPPTRERPSPSSLPEPHLETALSPLEGRFPLSRAPVSSGRFVSCECNEGQRTSREQDRGR